MRPTIERPGVVGAGNQATARFPASLLPGGWWGLVVVVLAVVLAGRLVALWPRINNHDFAVFYRASERWLVGESIYADTAAFKAALDSGTFALESDIAWPYAYPPLPAIVMSPLTWLPYEQAAMLWTGANVAWLLGGVALTVGALRALRPVGGGGLTGGLLACGLALLVAFYPAEVALRLGQLEILQFFVLALAFRLLVARHDRAGGALLGLGMALKFFPGILLGLLLWQRRWQGALVGVLVGVGGIALGYTVVGWHEFPAYVAFTSAYTAGGMLAFPFNQSLMAFWTRNLTENLFSAPLWGLHLPGVARALGMASILAVGLPTLWLCRGEARGMRFALSYALSIVTLLLVVPHSQVYGFVWLLIPLLVMVAWVGVDRGRWPWWLLLGLVYLLVAHHWVVFRPLLTRLVAAHVTGGALVLWALVALALWRTPPTTSEARHA